VDSAGERNKKTGCRCASRFLFHSQTLHPLLHLAFLDGAGETAEEILALVDQTKEEIIETETF
jgi:hypothetical protein